MDFVFGTFATDELKVVHHRTARRGVQHGYAMLPRDPQPGDPVTLLVRLGIDQSAEAVACYYALDGSLPQGSRGAAINGQVIRLEPDGITWDAVAWGYISHWRGVIPGQPEGAVVRYRIGAWTADGAEVFADWPDVQDTAEQAAAAFFRGDPLPDTLPGDSARGETFSYHVDRLTPPEWARRAVIYQVFVDRFYPGDGRDWLEPESLRGFFGGTLWGVRDKLDYIADLGTTCIWLSPTWTSPSYHGYDVTDYQQTEPRLGGDEALHALVEAAHARGLRVLLDMVCNHVSDQHPIFQEALRDPRSPCRDWFTFDDSATSSAKAISSTTGAYRDRSTFDDSATGYRCFFGVPAMPEINTANEGARQWLCDIARYWLREFKIDGYRLDYANGPGPAFWSQFRAACRAENPAAFCFGEIVDQPASLLPYVGRLDGCLDFHIGEALRKTFAYGVWSQADFERFLERHEAYFSGSGDFIRPTFIDNHDILSTAGETKSSVDFIRPTFIDNHDMDRFLYAARGDQDALRRAAAAQMRLPGPPIIYYGTEVGLTQLHGKEDGFGLEVSRTPMVWGDAQDQDLLTYYKELIRERQRLHL